MNSCLTDDHFEDKDLQQRSLPVTILVISPVQQIEQFLVRDWQNFPGEKEEVDQMGTKELSKGI